MCIFFLFRMNLYELIKKNNFQGFSIALIRRFAFSLLQCLKMLHRERIIHCDLKPVSLIFKIFIIIVLNKAVKLNEQQINRKMYVYL